MADNSKLTKKEKANYLKYPNSCPKCKSDDYQKVDTDGDFKYYWMDWRCSNCDFEWTEEYKLVDLFLK